MDQTWILKYGRTMYQTYREGGQLSAVIVGKPIGNHGLWGVPFSERQCSMIFYELDNDMASGTAGGSIKGSWQTDKEA